MHAGGSPFAGVHEAVDAFVETVMGHVTPAPPDEYRDNLSAWAYDKLGITLWSMQREIGRSVVEHPRTAVKSCHGSGKSFLAALIIVWWIHTRPPSETFVLWTAPVNGQVSGIIGRYIIALLTKLDTGFHCTKQMDLYAPDGQLIGQGRSPSDHDSHTFQGKHAKWLLEIVDEGCGIAETIWNAITAMATAPTNRVLALGNPDDPGARFARLFAPESSWSQFRIDAFDTPNFTDEKHHLPAEMLETLVNESFVELAREDYGEDTPLWTSKVRGEFPEVSEDLLIPPAWILRAQNLELPGLDDGVYAFDIGRGGDETVGYRNRGGHVREVYSSHIADLMAQADDIAAIVGKHNGKVGAWIDAPGMGWGPYDRLKQLGIKAWPFLGGPEQLQDKRRFMNRRAEVYWSARDLFRDGLVDLDPADKKLAGQLGNIKWSQQGDRIRLERKEEMKRRGVKSPDRADAVVMSLIPAPRAFTPPPVVSTRPAGFTSGIRGEQW